MTKLFSAAAVGILAMACVSQSAGTRDLTPDEMAALFGRTGNSKCAGFSDCGAPCAYNETTGKCESCVPPAMGTTQYPDCLPSNAEFTCEHDTSQTDTCGWKGQEEPRGTEGKCHVMKYNVKTPLCYADNKSPACKSYFKLKSGQTICPKTN